MDMFFDAMADDVDCPDESRGKGEVATGVQGEKKETNPPIKAPTKPMEERDSNVLSQLKLWRRPTRVLIPIPWCYLLSYPF